MSHSHIFSAGVAVSHPSPDDDDDNDICPVCDGECTCANRSSAPSTALANSNGSAQHVPIISSSSSSSSLVPGIQSLKIKLMVPPSMLSKRRPPGVNSQKQTTFADSHTASVNEVEDSPSFPQSGPAQILPLSNSSHRNSQELHASKRRGRPPKQNLAAQDTAAIAQSLSDGNEAATLSQSPSPHVKGQGVSASQKNIGKSSSNAAPSRGRAKPKAKGTVRARASDGVRKNVKFDHGRKASEFSKQHNEEGDDDDDACSGEFPTFMSASALSSLTSSENESSASDSDSSMEAEEERYILTEERRHEKARVRRELLGDEGLKRKDNHTNWIIRPRKNSVGPSDVDMDVESDDLSDDEEEDDEKEDDEEADEDMPRITYTGIATGWSEDDESSLDADLFFANLASNSSSEESSSDDEDGASDMNVDNVSTASTLKKANREMTFEIAEGWDGQIVFTNGVDGEPSLDLDLDVTAGQEEPPPVDTDVEMRMTEEEDAGYDQDDDECELDESDGETTEDELVDEKGLPTSRAMKLFRWPTSISSINPLSTVSPTVSPAPNNRKRFRLENKDPRESPSPADILAGKVFFDDSDEHDLPEGREGSVSGAGSSRGGVLVMGQFNVEDDPSPKKAILNGSNKDVPSPFPRLGPRRKRLGSSDSGSFSGMRGRRQSRPSSLSMSRPASHQVLSSEEFSETMDHEPSTQPIDLDDVLDPSYLQSEPCDSYGQSGTASEGEMHRHLQNLSRWERIPMGTFRRTQESTTSSGDIPGSVDWSSEIPPSTPSGRIQYGSVMRSSPFSAILWQGKSLEGKGTTRRSRGGLSVIISPVLLPVRDGDRTPPYVASGQASHMVPFNQHTPKTRKELRKEAKMKKRKNHGPVHHHNNHHQQHHHHHHHPNTKSRSTAAVQRTSFFSSPGSIPPFNL